MKKTETKVIKLTENKPTTKKVVKVKAEKKAKLVVNLSVTDGKTAELPSNSPAAPPQLPRSLSALAQIAAENGLNVDNIHEKTAEITDIAGEVKPEANGNEDLEVQPQTKTPPKTGEIQHVPINLICDNLDNPCKVFNEAELLELGATMQECGLLEPIIVRPIEGTVELSYVVATTSLQGVDTFLDANKEQVEQPYEPYKPLPFQKVNVGRVERHTPYEKPTPKVQRNEPCPCGSGRKYKHCCIKK